MRDTTRRGTWDHLSEVDIAADRPREQSGRTSVARHAGRAIDGCVYDAGLDTSLLYDVLLAVIRSTVGYVGAIDLCERVGVRATTGVARTVGFTDKRNYVRAGAKLSAGQDGYRQTCVVCRGVRNVRRC